MIEKLSTKKLGIYLVFFILFFSFAVLEFNFKDEIIMCYNISQTHKVLEPYKEYQFNFNELTDKDLKDALSVTDSLQTRLEQKWIRYVTISVIKDKHNGSVQHDYIRTQKDINFIRLMITTEINRRQYENIRRSISPKFKF